VRVHGEGGENENSTENTFFSQSDERIDSKQIEMIYYVNRNDGESLDQKYLYKMLQKR